MARHLASIQRVKSINTIPNADKIEVVEILGWHCVVKKGEFKVGDLVCYFEVDSLLPIRPEFEFLRKQYFKKTDFGEGFRLKTIRLRGCISQGLVMPISIVPKKNLEEGEDITELMKVTLYSPPIPADLKGVIKGAFPSFMAKTDETRVQVLQDVLTRHKGTKCYITEKIDGTSATFFIKDGVFGVCSRNLELCESENAYWRIAKEYDIEGKLRMWEQDIAIQGEIYGTGLQGNPLRVPKKEIRFFNAFNIKDFKFYDYNDFKHIMNILKLPIVPVITEDFDLIDNVETLLKLAVRKSSLNPESWAEGIVIRPLKERFDMQMVQGFGNGRISFKAVNQEYLLESDN